MGLGSQPRRVWDWNPKRPGTAAQVGLGLQPKWVWDYNRNGSGMTVVLQKELQELLPCKQPH